jgi:hypothetical protein
MGQDGGEMQGGVGAGWAEIQGNEEVDGRKAKVVCVSRPGQREKRGIKRRAVFDGPSG